MKSSTTLDVIKYDSTRYAYHNNERVANNENGENEYEYDVLLVEADSIDDARVKAEKILVGKQLEADKDAFIEALMEANATMPTAIAYKVTKAKYDSIGKVVQDTGDGTPFNPYKVWKVGIAVKEGDWWQTEDGYLWQAIKSGTPSSSTDKEYWDIVE